MKPSMILVPLLAGLGMAGVVKQRDESVADVAAVANVANGAKVADSINNANVADSMDGTDGAEVCCNTTPCFVLLLDIEYPKRLLR
ncbi:hypothetical protein AtubIFM57258_008133 [Aspergillus tubingensis]|nr:hypothetical protein AtubIFM57258_008133 [Aspergillus tubingensis]